MRYFGGKMRIARELAAAINQIAEKHRVEHYHEPFCGVFNVGSKIKTPSRSAADTLPDLILMLQAVQAGWNGPSTVSKAEYERLRHAEPSALRGFIGIGCSFGGKFFGGYAKGIDSQGVQNFAAYAHNSLADLAPKIEGVQFDIQNYLEYDGAADLIYADPPYYNTTGYTVGKFDSDEFWRWAKEEGRRRIVLFSEYSAPPWATVLWEKPQRTQINNKKGKIPSIEKLFVAGRV